MRLHPVHTMIVHFPAALFPVDFIFSMVAIFSTYDELAVAAYYCLLAGTIGGWLAMLTGVVDLFKYVVKPGSIALPGIIHSSVQTIVVIGYTMMLAIEYHHMNFVIAPPVWLWATKFVLLAIMFVGNYFG